MNHKFRLAISAASFFVVLSGSLIALNNLSLSSPSQYAQAAADPNAPTNPAVKLPGSATTGTGTTSNTGTGGPIVVTPTAPAVNNVGLLDGVANGGQTVVTPTTPTTPTTVTSPSTTVPTTNAVPNPQQAAANSSSTVRTGGIATTGLILIAAIGVGIYYYQKTHMQSKFALKMSEKKIGGRK